jgi:hypothetical protein
MHMNLVRVRGMMELDSRAERVLPPRNPQM